MYPEKDYKKYLNFEVERNLPLLHLFKPEHFSHLISKIVLGRHGKTIYNSEGRLQGSSDIPLSSEGILEMKHEAILLKEHPQKICHIVSSDMIRAKELQPFSPIL